MSIITHRPNINDPPIVYVQAVGRFWWWWAQAGNELIASARGYVSRSLSSDLALRVAVIKAQQWIVERGIESAQVVVVKPDGGRVVA